MKKLLMILSAVLFTVLFSCQKTEVSPIVQEVGCHTYTTPAELARLAAFVENGTGIPADKYVEAKGIHPDYVEIHCAWLHWGKCCPYDYRQYCTEPVCPVCGGITIRTYVPACP